MRHTLLRFFGYFLDGYVRVYELLFPKFCGLVRGGGGGEISIIVGRLCLKLADFTLPYLIILLSANSYMPFFSCIVFFRLFLPFLPLDRLIDCVWFFLK